MLTKSKFVIFIGAIVVCFGIFIVGVNLASSAVEVEIESINISTTMGSWSEREGRFPISLPEGMGVGLVLGVRIINKNPVPIHMKELEYTVRHEGASLGSGGSIHSTVIPANGSDLVHVDVALDMGNFGGVIFDRRRLTELPELDVETVVQISVLSVPMTREESFVFDLDG